MSGIIFTVTLLVLLYALAGLSAFICKAAYTTILQGGRDDEASTIFILCALLCMAAFFVGTMLLFNASGISNFMQSSFNHSIIDGLHS